MAALRLAPGSLLGDRFVLEQLAGSGGMGEVYRARDVRTQETVAVKVLHRSDPAHATRFLREARVLAQLKHPSIVRYVAHGDSPSLYLVMEWLEGEDLGHRLSRQPLDVKETVLVARRVADALGAAHAHGVVHRDIKPSNIFLLQRRIEQVRLLDFGIAFLAQGTRAVTVSGQVLGTLGYMAPEQASEGRKVTAAADVFSLGCLVFECLTGRAAFPGERLMEVLAKILFAETPRVSDLCLGVHPAVD
jgi:serine/threonine protein kinase